MFAIGVIVRVKNQPTSPDLTVISSNAVTGTICVAWWCTVEGKFIQDCVPTAILQKKV